MEFCSLILVVMISVAYSGFVSATVEGNSFAVRNGWKNFGGLLASYRVRSRIDCMRACLTSQECNSVNLGSVLVGRNRVECELVTTDQNSLTSITEAPGWSLTLGESGSKQARVIRCVHNGIESGLRRWTWVSSQVKPLNPESVHNKIKILALKTVIIAKLAWLGSSQRLLFTPVVF